LEPLKREILELLEKDIEFRYAIAGYLGLSELLKRLDSLAEEQTKTRKEVERIWKEIERVWREIERLRDDFNRFFKLLDARLSRVERTLEKLTLEIEEEARIIIGHRLKEMGYDIKVSSLILPDVELNIYGVLDDICIVGEATVRASSNLIDEVDENIKRLRRSYPDKIRGKVIRVIYTSLAMPDLIERAESEGVWVLKATEDIVKPKNF